ncbi:MAG: dipeptide ABC transporter ATP-binding protein, partial [Alphaproteobacteria bacterium]
TLFRSVPRLDRPRGAHLQTIDGLPPNLLDPPAGCRFAPRCGFRIERCAEDPPLIESQPGHRAACWRQDEVAAIGVTYPAPSQNQADTASTQPVVLSVGGLRKYFNVSRGGKKTTVRAVDDVSFAVHKGETLGLVGESGCGKTTVGRLILRLEQPTAGTIRIEDQDAAAASGTALRALRRRIQVIFQDPYASLNPRMTIGQIIAEPMLVHGLQPNRAAAQRRVEELLVLVGLFPYMADRYPHEMSGGQRQRVGIARALAMEPSIIVCDEPVSALDVSIQGQIINLLDNLQRRLGLTYLFIAHDLAVVRHISHRVAVMYLGRIMEIAERDTLYARPLHPYTKALLDAAPIPDPVVERARPPRTLGGEIPSPLTPPSGCVFHSRCPQASDECRAEIPALREIAPGQFAACLKL